MVDKKLIGQTAIVTGANSGIGEGVAMALGESGANIVVNYVVDPDAANTIVDKIKAFGSNALAIQADVSKERRHAERGHATLRFRSDPRGWSGRGGRRRSLDE